MIDSVTGKKEGMKAREKRKVAQRGQVVIREVNYILVLEGISTRSRQKPVCPNAISGDTEKQQHQQITSTHLGNTQVLNCGDLVP